MKPYQQIINKLYTTTPLVGKILELFITNIQISDVFNEALSKNLLTIFISTSKIKTPSNITTLNSEILNLVINPLANTTLDSNINNKVISIESISYKRTISKVDSLANNNSSKLLNIITNCQTRLKIVDKEESLLLLK